MSFPKKNLWQVFILLYVPFLYGCQYAYHQDKEEVNSAKNMSVESFIKEKIIDSDNVISKGILMAFEPISKVTSVLHGGKSIQEEKNYRKENFVYKALFDLRNHSLTKPKNDLGLFCRVNGGSLKPININRVNLANSGVESPLFAYVNAMRQNVSGLSTELKITPDISIPINISREKVAQIHAQIAEDRNVSSGIYTAQRAIQSAINQESFGEFVCMKPEGKELWSVDIIPLILERQKGVVTGDPVYIMYLGIVPTRTMK